jgi:putative addiction module component (TIGR02574 family)
VTDEARRILEAAMQLPEDERAELAATLMDSVSDAFASDDVKAAWIVEVRRRMAALERGESSLVDFDDAMDRFRAKVQRVRERRASTG